MALALAATASTANAQDFSANMDLSPPPGWTVDNNSSPIGAASWFQGNAAVFTSQAGATNSYVGCNFQSIAAASTGTISNWLISPVTTVGAGGTLTFWTRTISPASFADRLQVRVSTNGASVNVGTSATDLGDFTTLLLDINPTYTLVGYPTSWTLYTVPLSGTPTSGRIAFRYFVENGGETGANSDYIGIDTVAYTQPVTNCLLPLPFCRADIQPNNAVDTDDLLLMLGSWGQVGPPRPAGDIEPIPAGNCTVDTDDLLAMLGSWGSCPPSGACVLATGACSVTTSAQCTTLGGIGFAPGANCTDTDGDRLPNAFELNNCSAMVGGFAGTNPAVADTDGDNIRDGDEVFTTVGGLNLRAMGANPLRKNIFMEIDWAADSVGGTAHNHQPPAGAIAALINAFNSSPTTNPCGGANGITMIIDYGQGGLFTGGNLIGTDDTIHIDIDYVVYKASNFAANRNGYFYYAMHCHYHTSSGNGSSGIAELPGDDHIVSLQGFYTDVSANSKTMMHEFGHNLGLRHGGNVDTNGKPNYNSVMNYRYQFPGCDTNCNAQGDGVLNYSTGVLASLNENALLETNGICSGVDIDWNGNAIIDAAAIARNINCDAGFQGVCAAGVAGCYDTACGTLNDFNDWANISFAGLSEGDFVPPEIISCDAPRVVSPPRRGN